MSRRTETRIIMEVPVRLWGTDADGKPFNLECRTLDISRVGARIEGVSARLKQGDIIGIQSAFGKARFRVTWVGHEGSHAYGKISVCCVEPGKCIWDPKFLSAKEETNPTEPLGSRRKAVRYICPGAAEASPRSGMPLWGKLSDISDAGCYIETPSPLPPRTKVHIKLTIGDIVLVAEGEVRTAHTTVGMGLAFEQMSDDDNEKLRTLLDKLSGNSLRDSNIAENLSRWMGLTDAASDALDGMKQLLENGDIVYDPALAGDLERLMRNVTELRDFVMTRVSNYE